MTLEEVGGTFDVTGDAASPPRAAAPRRAISVIPPGMAATGQATTLRFMRQLLLQLDGPTLSAWLDERVDIQAAFAPRLMLTDPRLLQLGHLIARQCASGEAHDRLYCDGLVVAVLGALANLPAGADPRRDGAGGLAPWQVRRVTEYLREHLAESVEMATLAGIACLSKAHFSRAFKVSTGLPPHRWLLNARIARAREMLIDGDLPLAEISLAVGFADQAHFTRTFGAIVGTSPRAWQRARGGQTGGAIAERPRDGADARRASAAMVASAAR
jgi:AraC-like DNA-binding protein